jgi:beta-lactamase regulating signal transducer with metallopeptidase domain
VADLHPVIWWILRQIEREREMACDEWAVSHTGAARPYAETLVRLSERGLAPEHSVLASGIFTRRSNFIRNKTSPRLRGSAVCPRPSKGDEGAAAAAAAE